MTQGGWGRRWLPEARAVREMFGDRVYLWSYPFLALGVGLLYAFLLPGLTLGSFAPWVLSFLRPNELAFSIGIGLLLPLVALLNVFLWRHPSCVVPARGASNGSLASIILGIIPNALCCTPIIPSIIAVFATGATLISISAPVQYFLNVYASLLYALATLGVWVSLRLAARRFQVPGVGET